ncbi:hypothetical protein [Yoonia sp.]|uniref:hypothetical protein n=1 Tax=Yoonia sp. TaxID=2212373 RepID=UPI002DFD3D13|nr:hypothetical protein [Yoonia sp.]
MKKAAITLLCLTTIAPSTLLADDNSKRIQVLLCQTDDEVSAFSFLQQPDGDLSLLGEGNATVTKGDSAVTVIIGETVLQFQNNQLHRLTNGTLKTTECADVTDTVAQLSKDVAAAESGTALVLGAIVPASTPPSPSSPPMTGEEREALRIAVNRCWNVDPGSVAARATVEVSVSLTREGRVDGEPHLLSSSGDATATATAFEAARRAILRCQGSGYQLPPAKFDQWQNITMTFDPSGLSLR